jgi:hypothetical protein
VHRPHHESSHEPTERSLADHAPSRVGVAAHGLSPANRRLRRRAAASAAAIANAPRASSRVRRRIQLALAPHRARHRRPNPHSDVAPIGPAADHVAASSLGAYPTSALRPWPLAAKELCTGGYRINLNRSRRSRLSASRRRGSAKSLPGFNVQAICRSEFGTAFAQMAALRSAAQVVADRTRRVTAGAGPLNQSWRP